MNLSKMASRARGSAELYLKKNGPTILVATGIAGFGITTWLTGKAVLKSQDKVKMMKIRVEEVATRPLDENFTKKDQAREAGQVWIHDSLPILRDFAPAIVTGTASIACILAAHGILRQQRTALVAAYAALDGSFRAYRRRVVEEVGEEVEEKLYNDRYRTLEQDAEGELVESCEIDRAGNNGRPSMYARWFTKDNKNWDPTPDYNFFFLKTAQDYATDLLGARGHLFLNEVYDELGLPRSKAGQVVGWLSKDKGGRDGYVDFGIFDKNEQNVSFVNGNDNELLLDFNVDGVILETKILE